MRVEQLLELAQRAGRRIDLPLLERIVAENNKQRFKFSDDAVCSL